MSIFKSREQRQEARARKQIERERTRTRKPDAIGKDYGQVAAEIGDKVYQVKVLEAEIEQLHQKLLKYNQEFQKAQIVWAEPNAKPVADAPEAVQAAIEHSKPAELPEAADVQS